MHVAHAKPKRPPLLSSRPAAHLATMPGRRKRNCTADGRGRWPGCAGGRLAECCWIGLRATLAIRRPAERRRKPGVRWEPRAVRGQAAGGRFGSVGRRQRAGGNPAWRSAYCSQCVESTGTRAATRPSGRAGRGGRGRGRGFGLGAAHVCLNRQLHPLCLVGRSGRRAGAAAAVVWRQASRAPAGQ